MNKDWKGNSKAVFVCNGATGHAEEERETNDYYATSPEAGELLLQIEPQLNNIWEAACVDCETEFFNGNKWKKISEYQKGDKVLSYDGEGSILEEPMEYIKMKTDEDLYYFEGQKLSMALSAEHRVIFFDRRNASKRRELTAKDVFEYYDRDSNGFRGKIPTAWIDEGNLEVDETLLRIAVACNADGTLRSANKNIYDIRVKKERKKKRIIYLLEKANIPYSSHKYEESRGYLGVRFQSPLGCKHFPVEWLNLKRNLKEVILDEIKFWDGHVEDKGYTQYFTSKKEDADFIQLIAHSIGKSAIIRTDIRSDGSNRIPNYIITIGHVITRALSKKRGNHLELRNSLDGYKYCFKVSTGMLVLRRNNKIFITGNCGEGHLAETFRKAGKLKAISDLIDRSYHPEGIMQSFGKDFLQTNKTWKGDMVTNPPYSIALEWTQHSLDLLTEGRYLALFMKITFLEGKGRKQFFLDNPPIRVWVSSSRIPCAKNGKFTEFKKNSKGELIETRVSSATCYCWYVWQKGYKGPTELKWFN